MIDGTILLLNNNEQRAVVDHLWPNFTERLLEGRPSRMGTYFSWWIFISCDQSRSEMFALFERFTWLHAKIYVYMLFSYTSVCNQLPVCNAFNGVVLIAFQIWTWITVYYYYIHVEDKSMCMYTDICVCTYLHRGNHYVTSIRLYVYVHLMHKFDKSETKNLDFSRPVVVSEVPVYVAWQRNRIWVPAAAPLYGFDMIGFEELNMGTWARLKQVDAVTIFSLSGFGPTFSYGNWLGNDTFQSKPWFS